MGQLPRKASNDKFMVRHSVSVPSATPAESFGLLVRSLQSTCCRLMRSFELVDQ